MCVQNIILMVEKKLCQIYFLRNFRPSDLGLNALLADINSIFWVLISCLIIKNPFHKQIKFPVEIRYKYTPNKEQA